jgi:transcriptional regulator with XRE-family HTH domain
MGIIMSFQLDLDTPSEMRDRVRAAARARRLALGLTQRDLSMRSGVPLATLKLFEQKGQISLAGLLALADALDAIAGFGALFPAVEATRLDDLDRPAARQRARTRRRS